MISTRSATVALLFMFALHFASAASAAQYYVSPKGDDDNAGTSAAAPWRSIDRANRAVEPGDVVYLRGGKYLDDPIRPGRSGTASARIKYAAYQGEQPVLTSDRISGLTVAIELSDRSYITIDGIDIDGVQPSPRARVDHFANLYRAHYNTITHCTFRFATGWHGIRITYEAHHNRLLNNVFDVVGIYDDGTGQDSGDVIQIIRNSHHNLVQGNVISRGAHNLLQVDGYNNVIVDNTFENDWSDILGNDRGGRNLSLMGERNLFERNIVRDARRSTDSPSNAGKKTEGEGNIVRRNFIYGNTREGIISQSRNSQKIARDNHIFHNTIYANGGAAWGLTYYSGGDGVTNNVFKNNIVYSNRRDSKNGNADFIFRLNANPSGVVGQSLIEHNLIAKASRNDGSVDVGGGGGVMSLDEAESRYAKSFRNNIQAIPQFVSADPRTREDFQLAKGSRGIDEAAPLTRTRRAGSGDTVPVGDAGYFSDGFRLISGDRIRIGTGPVLTVVEVDYGANTLTLSEAAEWENDAPVSLEYYGAGPDIGASELELSPVSVPKRPGAPSGLSGTPR